ncbi:MAG: molybdopterin cofactor-binding domain-containing protein [Burkholderiaceae bacterium]
MNTQNPILNTELNRRTFLAGTGGLTFSLTLGGGLLSSAANAQANDPATKIGAWVTIGFDDSITVLAPTAEMGQGTLTALPLILAEELDADWSKVRAEFAPPNPKVYGNPHKLLNGGQASLASVAVPGYFMPLRLAGAQVRRVLLDAVAAKWNVPLAELSTQAGQVIHAKSNRHISYGDVAKFASVPAELPKVTEADLKKPEQFRLIGRNDIGRSDVASKVNGSAQFGMDVQVPGMVYATVLESPMEGAKAENVNTAEVMQVPGVTKVITLPFGVAVIGTSVQATRIARALLKAKVSWNTSTAVAAKFDSQKAQEDYARHGQDPNAKALDHYKKGDAANALGSANKLITATYGSEHCYHAQMEPMNCVAKVAADGLSAELWVGTQFAFLATIVASGILKTTPDKIKVHQYLVGGGFGRRIAPDIVAQAVVLANITKQPVKLILTREDDMAAARMRPMTHHVMKAGLDASGNLVGWRHRIVAENVDAMAAPARFQATGGKDYVGWAGSDLPHYGIPHVVAEGVREIRGMRVQPLRGIGAGYNKFAIEAFMDEVAQAKGVDPLALRLELTKDDSRAQAVIRAVAEMADFKRKRKDRGLGLAFSDYHGTLSAGVAEVSLNRKTGKIKVHNFWITVDPGLVIQPVNVQAQLEGSVVFGLSLALLEELTIKDGAVVQSNFNDYPVLRMSDMPEIHSKIVASNAAPTGMGEIGVLPVAPAIANAVFQLTGKRLRHLPMSPDRVKQALA